MTGAYADIVRLLRSARRRWTRIALLAGAGAGAAVGLVCLLIGAIGLAWGARLGLRWVALGGAVVALLGGLAAAVRDVLRRVGTDEAAARTVGSASDSLRSALRSSVELSAARERIAAEGQLSVALVDAHVERTAQRTATFDLSRVLPERPVRLAGLLLLGALLLNLAALGVGRGPLARAYLRVLRGDPPGSPVEVDPITGDVELTYRYPAYMHREPRTLSGTGGEIRAPKGSDVGLRTRADRVVAAAELVVDLEADPSARPTPSAAAAQGTGAGPAASPKATAPPVTRRYPLRVAEGRNLSGTFPVIEGGSYRFRFLDAKGKLVVEGPPIPIVVEPDAYPTVQLTAPERDVEVDPTATVEIAWQAQDDVALGEAALVLEPPQGEPKRIVLRSGDPVRRDSGTYRLPVAPLQLGEGERLAYRVEAADTDTVSGPKVASSDTHTLRIYSEAEHRRKMLERAREAYEELVANLGDRLDLRVQGRVNSEERLAQAQSVDARTRAMTERLRAAAAELRKDPAGPRDVAQALDNVAQNVRFAVEGVIGSRARLASSYRMAKESLQEARRQREREEGRQVLPLVERDDAAVERAEEKGVLYLEALLDKRRAEDLVRLAKNLSQKRRDLAELMERFRKAPSDQARQELIAQVRRMKEQVKDLLARMAELSKGFNDEHMNEEALAELAKSQDLMGGLDDVEKKLAQGDVEGAMKALDQMATAMDQMLAGLSRTAGLPDEKAQGLMKEMMALKEQLEKLEQAQRENAGQTDQVRTEYRRRVGDRLRQADAALKRLHELAQGAQKDVEGARPGVTFRAEPDFEMATESLRDLERALGMRELEGAGEAVRRAQPSVERLSQYLGEDASPLAGAFGGKDPSNVEEARRRVKQAVPKVREIRDALSRLLPDPRSVLSKEEQQKLGELSKREQELEQQAGRLQQSLSELSKRAPVFPPTAQGQLGDARGHMGEAASELGNRNPQRGHGEQELALDALGRFRRGMEEAARGMRQGGGPGGGFPFPFAEAEGQSGEGTDPSREKVKIPGAEAHKVPEAFRRDLLEAMKQGTPERYRPDVQRYYEELVK